MSKYKSKKTIIDGVKFDSKKEAQRYLELKDMLTRGEIKNLTLQPRYELIPTFKKNGVTYRKTSYVADFTYFDMKQNKQIVEDVKSAYTRTNPLYKIKKKLFEYTYQDLEIVEIV